MPPKKRPPLAAKKLTSAAPARRARKRSSTIVKLYLLKQTRSPKEEVIAFLCGPTGKLTKTQVHLDSLDDLGDKIRELLAKGKVQWP
ncbi:MAG: hypothetical protein JWM53_963 [bacterium]|nr:hypothetical protein [bacterium]